MINILYVYSSINMWLGVITVYEFATCSQSLDINTPVVDYNLETNGITQIVTRKNGDKNFTFVLRNGEMKNSL